MHVHANAAISVDGKLATRKRRQIAISGPSDFDRVDALRAEMDAVLVGVGTVLADDPSLTVPESVVEGHQPARVVLDSRGRTPPDARILSEAAPTYILTTAGAPRDRIDALTAAGATIIETGDDARVDVTAGFTKLSSAGIDRLLVEGGGEVLFSLFDAELIDVLTLYVSPSIIGGSEAPTLVDGDGFVDRFPSLELVSSDRLDDGILFEYAIEGWAEEPSA